MTASGSSASWPTTCRLTAVSLYAYVLLDNHFHILVRTPRANLSAFMQRLLTAYALYARYKHRRPGHVFQGRFRAKLVEDDVYLLAVTRYIHLNPVKIAACRRMNGRQRLARLEGYPRGRALMNVSYDLATGRSVVQLAIPTKSISSGLVAGSGGTIAPVLSRIGEASRLSHRSRLAGWLGIDYRRCWGSGPYRAFELGGRKQHGSGV